jgi:hypothetical protein
MSEKYKKYAKISKKKFKKLAKNWHKRRKIIPN